MIGIDIESDEGFKFLLQSTRLTATYQRKAVDLRRAGAGKRTLAQFASRHAQAKARLQRRYIAKHG